MKLKVQVLYFVAAGAVFALSGCATIVNDPNIPLAVHFSDGSSGQCTFKNKRGAWSTERSPFGTSCRVTLMDSGSN